MSAERLYADDSADHVAVDVDVADLKTLDRFLHRVVDPGMDAERQPVAGAFDCLKHPLEMLGAVTHHMQHRAENLFCQFAGVGQLEDMRCDVVAVRYGPGKMHFCLLL